MLTRQLRAYSLNYLKGQILPNYRTSAAMFTSVGDLEDCVHFYVCAFRLCRF